MNSPFIFTTAVLQHRMGAKVLPSGLLFVEYFLKSSREIDTGGGVGSLQVGTVLCAHFCFPVNIYTKLKSHKTEQFSGNKLKVSNSSISFSSFVNLSLHFLCFPCKGLGK